MGGIRPSSRLKDFQRGLFEPVIQTALARKTGLRLGWDEIAISLQIMILLNRYPVDLKFFADAFDMDVIGHHMMSL